MSFSPAPLQCDCFWFGLLFLTFLLSLGWLYIGLILLNDLHNFNECVIPPPFLGNLLPTPEPLGDQGWVPALPSSPTTQPLQEIIP